MHLVKKEAAATTLPIVVGSAEIAADTDVA
jgi:hypothetical protein